MEHSRWTTLGLALLLAGLLALGSPLVVAAADHAQASATQEDPNAPAPSDRNVISVPGFFSLWLGQGLSTRDNMLVLDGAQVDLPALNATATVDGFTFSLRDSSYGWDAITVTQAGPRESDALTIADTEVVVQGPAANFSTDLSTRIEVHPSSEVQAGATVALSYDGQTGQAGVAVADGSVQATVGPATVAVDGLSTTDGVVTVDAAQVVLPDAGIGVRLDGFSTASGQPEWQSLTWVGQEFQLGNAVTLTNNVIAIPGPSADDTAPVGGTTSFEVNAGDLAQANGQLVVTYDRTTGQPAFSLIDGSATLGVAGWNLAVSGINADQGAVTVDTVQVTAEPLSLQVQVSGFAVDAAGGASFDEARVLYLPDPAAGQRSVAGFELLIDSTSAGYIVTTTTLLPTAQATAP
ncbi:MAG TPA: hypothetical protein VL334_12395 [Anaerolineae bacterium]|nr:hypothetical protein [Anaerolineae bacterium]